MADTYQERSEREPTWRRCDVCGRTYFIGAVFNPRNHKRSPIPLSLVPSNDVRGNFRIDWAQTVEEVFDADNQSLGFVPIVVYGEGQYLPHSPSHFHDETHVHEGDVRYIHRPRFSNFRMRMDDDES